MTEQRGDRLQRTLRLVASQGWADQDLDVLGDLMAEARAMAELVVADAGASPQTRAAAQRFLDAVACELLG